jgi:hypothetical protein
MIGKKSVEWSHTGPGIDQKQDDIGFPNGPFRLLAHPPFDRIVGGVFKSCRIDQGEDHVGDPTLAFTTVTGHPRPIVNNRQTATDQPIEQGGLAHIGAPDDGYLETHGVPVLRLASCSGKIPFIVIPARKRGSKTGGEADGVPLDPRLRGDDEERETPNYGSVR